MMASFAAMPDVTSRSTSGSVTRQTRCSSPKSSTAWKSGGRPAVFASIADPIRLLDCVMPADGAAGLLMTSKRKAREKGLHNCVIPLGYAERTNFKGGENLVDVTRSGHEVCGAKALSQAGLGIQNIRSFHPYDDFLIAIIVQFEALGFCKPGQGIAFARWRRQPEWLAVVAGVRLSDIFTDATVIALARDTTWFAKATLAPMSLINLLMGLWLLRAYRSRVSSQKPAA